MALKRSLPSALLLALASAALAQSPAPPATAPADPRWQSLIARLASDSFADRQAAQKDLDALTWRDHDLLKQFAESTVDPEAKSRLAARLVSLEERMAYDPPPISLDLKDAPLADVVAALEKATGEKFNDTLAVALNRAGRAGNIRPGGPTFTLSAKEQPFWEIFRDLSDQHGLVLQPSGPTSRPGFRLAQQEPGLHPTQIVGGVAIFANSITRTASINLQNRPGQQVQTPTLTFAFSAMVDPRIKLVTAQPPRFFNVVDDAGNTLLDLPVTSELDRRAALSASLLTRFMNNSVSLPVLEKGGKKIASAKGAIALTLQLASDSIAIADADIKLNEPLTVGGQTILITEFTLVGTQLRYRISVKPNQVPSASPPPPVSMAILDATGQEVHTVTFTGSGGGSFSSSALKPPLKLQFTAATKTKDIVIPFELKDLPLP